MNLSYDSLEHYKTPSELIFRLRVWTDPALKKAPILMATQAKDWKGISVLNASEDIYSYFMSQDTLSLIQSNDEDIFKSPTQFDLMGVLTKLQLNFSNGLFNAGSIQDGFSALMWLGPKVIPCLNDAKNHISNYYQELGKLNDAYKNIVFIEHYPAQSGSNQDWFTKEKFFVISYSDGFRNQKCIVMNHSAMKREFGVTNI